ncbi:rCG28309 [Rattus norvegicus]|uniref:RCG28309 n=1 Tax=Rattus norvegicus TaxID=10116 RepID=A6IE46_RAT|nr:rCG28309 [Rattus norvegicus]
MSSSNGVVDPRAKAVLAK